VAAGRRDPERRRHNGNGKGVRLDVPQRQGNDAPGREPIAERPYTVGASSRPARMDCVETEGEHKGKTWQHIYRIEGDTLWVTHGPVGCERPRSFEDANVYVGIYKRVKR
jgi:uncharacterized protein (TIGR03067 family)